MGDNNKAIKTRDGEPIKLIDLLNESIQRAKQMVAEKNPKLSASEAERRAKIIGLGAVRYADLSQDRTLDYVFSWEKMLAMQGNTAPYLQYAVARIHSIFRKAETSPSSIEVHNYHPSTDSEKNSHANFFFSPVC